MTEIIFITPRGASGPLSMNTSDCVLIKPPSKIEAIFHFRQVLVVHVQCDVAMTL